MSIEQLLESNHTMFDENDKIIAEVKGSALLFFSKSDDFIIK